MDAVIRIDKTLIGMTDQGNERNYYNVCDPLELLLNDDTSNVLEYFNSLEGTTRVEKEGLKKLYLYVKNDKLTYKIIKNIKNYKLCCDDLILSYYSSLSPTNPDIIGCWQRWTEYLDKNPFNDANISNVRDIISTKFWNIGHDKNKKPVWFVSTEHYDDTYSSEDVNLASILFIKSMFCDKEKNTFDIVSLRQGCDVCMLTHIYILYIHFHFYFILFTNTYIYI